MRTIYGIAPTFFSFSIFLGNGELGLIKYYNGKFDAYQRTYVLQNFKCHPKYLMYILQNKLPKKKKKERSQT